MKTLLDRSLYWISGFLPFREISDGDTPYLERYYVGTLLGWRFYLHQFVGSDPDRGLHDHPWPRAFSLILSGFYYEETRSGERIVKWFNSLVGDNFHRVVLPRHPYNPYREVPCWTLFMHKAGSVKPWGFLRPPATPPSFPQVDYLIFEPYQYTREGSQKDWWLTAKRRQKTNTST